MMLNEIQLNQPIFQALGWALLHFIWQGALVALLYASLRVILRNRTANGRYAAACSAMLLMLALPIATTLIIKRAIPQAASPAEALSSPAATSWKTDATAEEVSKARAESTTKWTAASATTEQETTTTTAQGQTLRERLATLMPWLVSIWLAGVLLLSLRVLGGWVMAQRLKNWKTVAATAEWQATVERLAHWLRVSRPVRLCESVVADVPTVIGWLRPVILVPVSAFVGLSAQQIEALLAHELAHIRRHDYLVNLLQTAVETLLFYHPAVWWVSREIRTEREHCCDDLAVAACGNVLTYARALAELEQLRGSAVTPQLAVAADGGASLLGRIQRLIGTPASPHQRSNAWLASLVAIATIFCICVGARTTLFNSDANKDRSRTLEESSLQQIKYGSTLFSVATVSRDESLAKSQTVLHGINESVLVVGSPIQEDEAAPVAPVSSPAVVAQPLFGQALFGELRIAAPVIASSTITPIVLAKPTVGASTAAIVQPVQDDDEDKPSSSYIDALAAVGYTNLTVDQLIEMRNHGVSPAFIREVKALGYALPSVETAIRLADHGVHSRFIKRLADLGYKKLSFDELIKAADHGVNGDVVEALNAAGYTNLTMEQLIRTIDHGVGPSYIKAMAEVGFNNLSLDQLIRMRDHGVGPEYIREIRSLGYTNVTAEQFIRLRDHGVSATFLRKAKERGFNNLSLEELIRLRDADIL